MHSIRMRSLHRSTKIDRFEDIVHRPVPTTNDIPLKCIRILQQIVLRAINLWIVDEIRNAMQVKKKIPQKYSWFGNGDTDRYSVLLYDWLLGGEAYAYVGKTNNTSQQNDFPRCYGTQHGFDVFALYVPQTCYILCRFAVPNGIRFIYTYTCRCRYILYSHSYDVSMFCILCT